MSHIGRVMQAASQYGALIHRIWMINCSRHSLSFLVLVFSFLSLLLFCFLWPVGWQINISIEVLLLL